MISTHYCYLIIKIHQNCTIINTNFESSLLQKHHVLSLINYQQNHKNNMSIQTNASQLRWMAINYAPHKTTNSIYIKHTNCKLHLLRYRWCRSQLPVYVLHGQHHTIGRVGEGLLICALHKSAHAWRLAGPVPRVLSENECFAFELLWRHHKQIETKHLWCNGLCGYTMVV